MSTDATLTTPWPWDEITAWPSDVGPMTGSWSANQYSDDRATAYIRADIHAARIADLERQLAEARDKALEEAGKHIRQSPLLWPSDAEVLANEVRKLKDTP